jgi:hypothetical protein
MKIVNGFTYPDDRYAPTNWDYVHDLPYFGIVHRYSGARLTCNCKTVPSKEAGKTWDTVKCSQCINADKRWIKYPQTELGVTQ